LPTPSCFISLNVTTALKIKNSSPFLSPVLDGDDYDEMNLFPLVLILPRWARAGSLSLQLDASAFAVQKGDISHGEALLSEGFIMKCSLAKTYPRAERTERL